MTTDTVIFSTNTRITYGDLSRKINEGEQVNTETGIIASLLAGNESLKNITNALKAYMPKDRNEKDLTYEDLAYATSLEGQHGIIDVRRDANAGIVTFVCDDGINLSFDFETKAEKEKRVSLEKNIDNAKEYGYNDSYQIGLSENLDKYVITVNNFTCAQPTISHIAKDFGIKAQDLIRMNPHIVENFDPNDDNRYIEDTKVNANVKIELPTKDVKFNEAGPRGFLKRLFSAGNSNPHARIKVWESLEDYLNYYLNNK